MQFDHLVKSILEENNIKAADVPVLDGKKEVYCIGVFTASANHTGDAYVTPVERMDFDYGNPRNYGPDSDTYNCTGWMWDAYEELNDHDTLIYSGKDFQEVVNFLKSVQNNTNARFNWKYLDDRQAVTVVIHKLRPFSHIHGTWKIIESNGDGKRGVSFFIGIEVDQDYYRHGGITDAVKDTIDGEDISNW